MKDPGSFWLRVLLFFVVLIVFLIIFYALYMFGAWIFHTTGFMPVQLQP